jgi:isoleucyl-tRNA synthetase
MYKKVSTDMNFVSREKEVEKFWDDNEIFQKSMDEKEGCRIIFSMMDLRQQMVNRISDTF